MNAEELRVVDNVPFLFWVKDQDEKYIWGNRKICELAGEDVVGKTDAQLTWAENAQALREADKRVFASGEPDYLLEHVIKSSRGEATLSVCKWLGDFEGEKCCFGISFVIE
ncbi:PAS domain-containing protein [Microbulbifer sp. SSSA007]|uniref:PAS domain-containing protein n=1 Tax=Microbulbifer TaxID=48073 RepID=UPI00037D97FA|nr:PAS domain-containing protein [Microbulbifer variabilis]